MSGVDDIITLYNSGHSATSMNGKDMQRVIDARAELAQLRADLQAAQARIAQLDKMIALNRYVMPPFDLIDDATAKLALECAEKDRRIAEQARQLAEAREVIQFGAVMWSGSISRNSDYNQRCKKWLAAHPAQTEPQP